MVDILAEDPEKREIYFKYIYIIAMNGIFLSPKTKEYEDERRDCK